MNTTTSTRQYVPVKQHTTDTNRRKRRQLIKLIGVRQFKKLYKKAP